MCPQIRSALKRLGASNAETSLGMFDTDGDGQLSCNEFVAGVRTLGLPGKVSDQEIAVGYILTHSHSLILTHTHTRSYSHTHAHTWSAKDY